MGRYKQKSLQEWVELIKSISRTRQDQFESFSGQEWFKSVCKTRQDWSNFLPEAAGLVKSVYGKGWNWSRVSAGVGKIGQTFCRSRQDWSGVSMGVGRTGQDCLGEKNW